MIKFTDFEIDPLTIISTCSQNRINYWPEDWSIVQEKEAQLDLQINYPWFRKNCIGRWQHGIDFYGARVFAFEHEDEAILFKLSF